jgi:hypothetical protein
VSGPLSFSTFFAREHLACQPWASFYSALRGTAMQQHPAIWRRAVSAMEPGAIAGTTHSTGRLLQRGRPRSCQRGSNGLADRVTSAEYVRERPSREPCGALAYSSDEQYSSSATRTLSVHRRCGIAAREGPMTRLRASIPLRDRRGLVDDSVGWCLVRTGGCDCGREASGRSVFPAAPSTT